MMRVLKNTSLARRKKNIHNEHQYMNKLPKKNKRRRNTILTTMVCHLRGWRFTQPQNNAKQQCTHWKNQWETWETQTKVEESLKNGIFSKRREDKHNTTPKSPEGKSKNLLFFEGAMVCHLRGWRFTLPPNLKTMPKNIARIGKVNEDKKKGLERQSIFGKRREEKHKTSIPKSRKQKSKTQLFFPNYNGVPS